MITILPCADNYIVMFEGFSSTVSYDKKSDKYVWNIAFSNSIDNFSKASEAFEEYMKAFS